MTSTVRDFIWITWILDTLEGVLAHKQDIVEIGDVFAPDLLFGHRLKRRASLARKEHADAGISAE